MVPLRRQRPITLLWFADLIVLITFPYPVAGGRRCSLRTPQNTGSTSLEIVGGEPQIDLLLFCALSSRIYIHFAAGKSSISHVTQLRYSNWTIEALSCLTAVRMWYIFRGIWKMNPSTLKTSPQICLSCQQNSLIQKLTSYIIWLVQYLRGKANIMSTVIRNGLRTGSYNYKRLQSSTTEFCSNFKKYCKILHPKL